MDRSFAHVGSDGNRFFIYLGGSKWLSKVDDTALTSNGSNSASWDGWYPTRREAETRLYLYKAFKQVSIILLGGE